MPCAKISGLSFIVLIIYAAGGYAQDAGKPPPAERGSTSGAVKTGKERLSDKASDDL